MSHGFNDHEKKHMMEAGVGMVAEVAKQAGRMQTTVGQHLYHASTHHGAGKVGAYIGGAVLAAAPSVAAGAVTVAAIAVPVAVVGGGAYAVYRLVKWLREA